MALARIYGIYPAADFLVQHGSLGPHERPALVPAPLNRPSSTDPNSQPSHSFTQLCSIHITNHLTFPIHHQTSVRRSQRYAFSQSPSKSPSRCPKWDPAENFRPNLCPHFQSRIQMKLSNQNSFGSTKLRSIPNFPNNQTFSRPELGPIHNPSKIPSHAPIFMIIPFHTKRTSIHTPNLPPILLCQPSSLHSPNPDSGSHMGYNRPTSRPRESRCTRIPGWIPSSGPVPDSSPGYRRESSRAQR